MTQVKNKRLAATNSRPEVKIKDTKSDADGIASVAPVATFDALLAEVLPQRFAPYFPTPERVVVVPVCAGCGKPIENFDDGIWCSLESYDSNGKTQRFELRSFHRASCDLFHNLQHQLPKCASAWWELRQLWAMDQRGPLDRFMDGEPDPVRRSA